MIECIFTIDYETFGNGRGSLAEHVFEPAEKLKKIFIEQKSRFVNFVEVAELEAMEAFGHNLEIDTAKKQIQDLHRAGFEIGLHIHPQWYNASYENGSWQLDKSEYNLCILPKERIGQIIDRAMAYIKTVLNEAGFLPLCFRNSNWLFQPTQPLASILADRGIRLDSSVFKGGFQHRHKLDYRQAPKNSYFWKFSKDVNEPDPQGALLEIPTFTKMVFLWKMIDKKRLKLQKESSSGNSVYSKLDRLKDFMRIRYPLKFDFCRLSLEEMTQMFEQILKEDKENPESFKPIVLIGHTKDLVDFKTIELFLEYLRHKKIILSTFNQVYNRCKF